MRMTFAAAALLTLIAAPAAAQHGAHAGGQFPEGWHGRVDRENQNLADVRFMAMGAGLHVVTGPHVILWDPTRTGTGAYRASATFTQARAPERLEGFGLLVGGRDLDAPEQDYLYFLIRHDGRYLIRHRAGDEVHTLVPWTETDAVRRPTATEGADNVVAIEALGERVVFQVNGTTVHTLDRVPMLNTDGIVGLRVGHHLDLHVRDLTVSPAPQ
jgi:hypothetical protein